MRATIGLSDLARIFHLLPREQRDEHASWLGFRLADLPSPGRQAAAHPSTTTASMPEPAGARELGMQFWRLEAAIERELPPIEGIPAEEGLSSIDLDTGRSLSNVPPSPPLSLWPMLWSRLRAALHGSVASREPDVAALVRTWARGARVDRIQRLVRRTWAAAATIWIDRAARLVPFWSDQDSVRLQLERLCGPRALAVRILDANLQAVTWERHGDLVGRWRLDPSAPLLLLGDLGLYGSERDRTRWAATARRLRHEGIRVAALVPCSPLDARWDRDLARIWNAMPWERSPFRSGLTGEERAHRLLRLVAPTFLAQPGLVRAFRQLLPAAEADASTEVDAWQHRDVHAADVTGLVLDPAASRRLRAEFAELNPARQAEVRVLIEQWHRDLPPELLHAETLAWLFWNQSEAPGDVDRAKAFVRRVTATAWTPAGDNDDAGLARDYGCHLLGAVHDALYDEEPALKKLWSVARAHLVNEQRPITIAAHEVVRPGHRLAPRWWAFHQQGDALIVVPAATGAWSASRAPGSPVAMIVAEQPTVWVWYGEEIRPTAITLRYGAAIRLQRGEPLVLETDLGGEVVLEVWQRPQWAVAAGQDQYGLWAAFEAGGVQQRMRWIPPGAFLMGSPPTEVGRFEDEGPQHRVRFAKGYWLGETPVTQALWRAVMKSNPSYHKSDELPVDQVSWDVCQKFVEHLNRSLVGLVTRLPIETEWERACRAGTTSPTWVNDAAALGERKVVPAGKLQPNPYGLYGMLGDVFEWCQDAANDTGQPYPYKLDLSDDPEPAAHGSSRVIRGGSWFGTPAAGGRSASRTAGKRELAMEGLGLRLAVSQELAPEEALPKSDEALLARWGAGDSGSGEVLFERYYDMVARFFRNKVSKDLALDLVQETFVSCVTNREKIRFPFRLHVFKIAYKVLETHLRKDFRGVLAVDDSVVMEITPHSDDRPNRLLLDALRRIPLEDQMVLELHYWENLALDQIAEAFEISAPAARGRLTRARWRLSETLKHISFDELDDAEFDDRIATTKELEELDELRKLRKLPKRF